MGSTPGTRGSITIDVIAITLVVGVVMVIGSVILSQLLALHRAHTASDLAALAAATQAADSHNDQLACTVAGEVAASNGGVLTSCEVVRAGVEVAVSVEVEIVVGWKAPGQSGILTSVSYAGNPPI